MSERTNQSIPKGFMRTHEHQLAVLVGGIPQQEEHSDDARQEEAGDGSTGAESAELGDVEAMVVANIVYADDRVADEKVVDELVESLKCMPLLNPIVVARDGQLVAGRNRLEAFKRLGHATIPARVLDADGMDRQIAEIDENLVRKSFTALRRSEMLKRRKDLYEARHPESRANARGGHAKAAKGPGGATETNSPAQAFTTIAAGQLGVDRRTVEQEVRIAERICPEAKQRIYGTDLENEKVKLSKIADLDEEAQVRVVDALTRGEKNWSTALREAGVAENKGTTPRELPPLSVAKNVSKRLAAMRDGVNSLGTAQSSPKLEALSESLSAAARAADEYRDSLLETSEPAKPEREPEPKAAAGAKRASAKKKRVAKGKARGPRKAGKRAK